MKQTPLFEVCNNMGAKLIPFGEWELPLQFSGINDEHMAVRTHAGLFDASHMGEIRVKGDRALEFLQRVTCSDVGRRKDGQAQYTAFLNENGGIIDDIIYYRISENEFFICVNAANTRTDFQWLKQKDIDGIDVIDESSDWAQLCVQGPKALKIVEKISSEKLSEIHRFSFTFTTLAGVSVLAAWTGYTGEDGLELFIPAEDAARLWSELLEAGKEHGLKPCGLGARDTLRLEMGYPLHGHDIALETTPLEADLEWIVAWDKKNFIGHEALKLQKQAGIKRKRIGFEMIDPGIPREGCALKVDGREVGRVTSGTKTACLEKPVGMGYIRIEHAEEARELTVEIRGRERKARIKNFPFYRKGQTS